MSGGSTLRGTPGGDRWAPVPFGQIGRLSDHLGRVHDGWSETRSTNEFQNAKSWKARKKYSPHPKQITKFTAADDRDQLETVRGENPPLTR